MSNSIFLVAISIAHSNGDGGKKADVLVGNDWISVLYVSHIFKFSTLKLNTFYLDKKVILAPNINTKK